MAMKCMAVLVQEIEEHYYKYIHIQVAGIHRDFANA